MDVDLVLTDGERINIEVGLVFVLTVRKSEYRGGFSFYCLWDNWNIEVDLVLTVCETIRI